jgi:hypothetical protein
MKRCFSGAGRAFGVTAAVAVTSVFAPQALAQTAAWQPIELDLTGPQAQETGGGINPFLDRRLDVTFELLDSSGQPTGITYRVPGFFAADGSAADTHATSGTTWRTRFTPDQAGTWRWTAEFYEGSGAAVADQGDLGTFTRNDAALSQTSGTLAVTPRDPNAPGFLGRGRLAYTGGHYLQTLGDGRYWIKTGVDSPENPLGYLGFDNTTSQNGRGPDYVGSGADDFPNNDFGRLHRFPTHRSDWNPGDPDWQRQAGEAPGTVGDRDGRNLIGAVNYLADAGANSIYFLPMNLGGDGDDSYPFTDPNDSNNDAGDDRYDVSKLAQWERFFDHAQRQGIHLHVVLNEAETDNKRFLDNGALGDERRLFYREMIARFGHHNALQWNISEEYNLNAGFDQNPGNGDQNEADEAATVLSFAEFIAELDAYDHPTTVHNAGGVSQSNPANSGPWRFFIGEDDFDLTSLQQANKVDGWSDVVENFREATGNAGRPIPIMIDEPGSIDRDADDNTSLSLADATRRRMTYDILFSGGGVEWFAESIDQSLENFRSDGGSDLDQIWNETAIARRFLEDHTRFWEMEPDDELLTGENSGFGGAEVFAILGEQYAIYFPDTDLDDNGTMDLSDADGQLLFRWFNPTTGEFVGDAVTLQAGASVLLPRRPSEASSQEDWVALIVPEPATASLLMLPLLLAVRRRFYNCC